MYGMNRDRIVFSFDRALTPGEMSRLADLGYLWCNFSELNRSSAEILWKRGEAIDPMAVTIEAQTREPTGFELAMLVEAAFEHFLDIRFIDVLSFPDKAGCDVILAGFGFRSIEPAHPNALSYVRA